MKAPTTYEEAEILSERLELALPAILLAYDILDPHSQDLLKKLDIAVANKDISQMWNILYEAEENDICIVVKVLKAILAAATDIEDMWNVYRYAPLNNTLETEALNKILLATKSIEEMWKIHIAASCNVLKANALRTIMNSSQDPDVLRRVYTVAPDLSDVKLRSLKKIVELSPSPEETPSTPPASQTQPQEEQRGTLHQTFTSPPDPPRADEKPLGPPPFPNGSMPCDARPHRGLW